MATNLKVNPDRIANDISALAQITEPDHPYTRRAFTPRHAEGRAYLEKRLQEAGLTTRVDAAGNLIGRREGTKPSLGTLMLGSHSDTVPDGGRFDGVAGVIAALEVARALADSGIELDHSLEIVDFLAEEVSIFGVSCIGSRGMVGVRPDEWLTRRSGAQTLSEGIVAAGGDPSLHFARTDIRGFLELHIEQGPVLETQNKEIGVVTAISGVSRIEVFWEGRADHAGTAPMPGRRDALCAASQLVLLVQQIANELCQTPGHFAATVGEFDMQPNAANVVPSHVRMLIDCRAEFRADFENFSGRLRQGIERIAHETGVSVPAVNVISDNEANPMDDTVISALSDACEEAGASHIRMASGAGHDAAFLAEIAKAGMVFIPCADGRSHAPEEWAENADIALGAHVMMQALQRLDKDLKE